MHSPTLQHLPNGGELWELSSVVGGTRQSHLLHSPYTLISLEGTWSRFSSQPAKAIRICARTQAHNSCLGCPQTPTTVLGPSAIYPWVSQQSALASSWSAKASLQRFAPMTPRVWNLPWLQLLAWCGLCLKFLADHTTSATAACCDAACP